ncbi:hypothetical protein GCM10010988_41380 [Cnuibacter physcomitrellae]|uniref:DUF6668 family protein n=1 Tax=Cnuibacter physcomitrellae TaxID=1619308 RepID=UPI0012F4C087|nr:DUF6668 family protein [Cnuibacter physcomitrellae]GGI42906.1 hypothetical protein GCM10010988_41380 [Cnuibacter physcomitrellae]
MNAPSRFSRHTPEPAENPYLTKPEQAPVLDPGRQVRASRVSGPQPFVTVPDLVDALPARAVRAQASLWVVGVHGGAGVDTLTRLGTGWAGIGRAWPAYPDGALVDVVLAARTHYAGLRAAQNAARQWAAGQVPHVRLHGLVLTADAPGKLPKPLTELAHRIGGGVPRVWVMPWDENTRRTGQAPAAPAYTEFAADLTTILEGGPQR